MNGAKHRALRLIAVALIACLIPMLSGCGGGIVETALVVKKLYGLWELYKLFDNGSPSPLKVARAILKLDRTFDYSLSHFDEQGAVEAAETVPPRAPAPPHLVAVEVARDRLRRLGHGAEGALGGVGGVAGPRRTTADVATGRSRRAPRR